MSHVQVRLPVASVLSVIQSLIAGTTDWARIMTRFVVVNDGSAGDADEEPASAAASGETLTYSNGAMSAPQRTCQEPTSQRMVNISHVRVPGSESRCNIVIIVITMNASNFAIAFSITR